MELCSHYQEIKMLQENILENYRRRKVTSPVTVLTTKKRKSFVAGPEHLKVGATVKIITPTGIGDKVTTVQNIKDTLFSAGGFRFFKKPTVVREKETVHTVYGKTNAGTTAILSIE